MNRITWILLLLVALAFPGKAHSQIYEWVGTGGDTDWTNLSNWLETTTLTNPASLAALHSSARIQIGTNAAPPFTSNGIPTFPVGQTIPLNAPVTALWIGGAEDSTLTQVGGSITALLQVGAFGNTFPGRFVMSGGTFTNQGAAIVGNQSVAGHELTIGNASMSVTGAMTVSNIAGASSTVTINSGGSLTVSGNLNTNTGSNNSEAVVIVNNGGLLTVNGQFNFGNSTNASSTASVTVNTGGTVNVPTNVVRIGWQSQTSVSQAVVNIAGGQLNAQANDISIGPQANRKGTVNITAGKMFANSHINVGQNTSTEAAFNMSGGTAEAGLDFRAGFGASSTAHLDVSNGEIKARDILLGVGLNSIVNMDFSGGDLLASQSVRFGGPGSDAAAQRALLNMTMTNGSIVANQNVDFTRTNFSFAGGTIDATGGSVLSTALVDFKGGILSYAGDRTGDAAFWIGDGRFFTSLPNHYVQATFDGTRTYIQAVIPEPASLALLAIGLLAVTSGGRRRK